MPRAALRAHRQAIERLRAGDWQAAHVLVQALADPLACRIHALCHRIEGDLDNARYWYRRARSAFPDVPVAQELETLAAALDAPGERKTTRRR